MLRTETRGLRREPGLCFALAGLLLAGCGGAARVVLGRAPGEGPLLTVAAARDAPVGTPVVLRGTMVEK